LGQIREQEFENLIANVVQSF